MARSRSERIYEQQVDTVRPVLERIARYADAWVPHSSATADMVRGDWEVVQEAMVRDGRDPTSMSRVYSNFVHVLAPGEAPESAAPRFRTFSGMDLDYWQSFYLLGEAEPLAERIRGKIEALGGVDEVILNPLDWDVERARAPRDRGPAAPRRGVGRRRCPATSRRPGSTTPSRSFVRGRESSSPAPPTTTPPVSVTRGTRTSSTSRA